MLTQNIEVMKRHYLSLRTGLVALLLIFLTGCEKDELELGGVDANAIITAPGGGKGGGKDPAAEVAGNNLSFPVIWSDGVTKTLRGTYETDIFNGKYFTADGYNYYIQNDALNTWQAESFNPLAASIDDLNPISDLENVSINSIDWGDNLESKNWPYGSQIRVEVVLFKELDNSMKAYTMQIEDETQSGLTEVWGAKTSEGEAGPEAITYPSEIATVYSGMAKLVIQKIADSAVDLTWDPDNSIWTGNDVGAPLFEGGVWDATDGPGGYSAEINVQGKVIYGYNWVTRKTGDGAGNYRITFVLDPNAPISDINTQFNDATIVVQKVVTIAEDPTSGGVPVILPDYNLTYIDVKLTDTKGSGSGNSGGGSGNGGGHGR